MIHTHLTVKASETRSLPGSPRGSRADTKRLCPSAVQDRESVRSLAYTPKVRCGAQAKETDPEPANDRSSLPATLQFNPNIWKDWVGNTPKVPKTPSDRKLETYTAVERRVLESRLYSARMIHHKPDTEISADLDLCPSEFAALSPLSRPALRQSPAPVSLQ